MNLAGAVLLIGFLPTCFLLAAFKVNGGVIALIAIAMVFAGLICSGDCWQLVHPGLYRRELCQVQRRWRKVLVIFAKRASLAAQVLIRAAFHRFFHPGLSYWSIVGETSIALVDGEEKGEGKAHACAIACSRHLTV